MLTGPGSLLDGRVNMRKMIVGIVLALVAALGAVSVGSPAMADMCRMPDGTWRDC